MKILDNPKFELSQNFFVEACRASRMHDKIAALALSEYGDHGPLISGVVRDHFPLCVKTVLRALALEVTDSSTKARMWRPKNVRRDTITALGRAVATRDGSGYYGPQPLTREKPVDAKRAALEKALSFIEGFEGDEMQEGIDSLLSEIRGALA